MTDMICIKCGKVGYSEDEFHRNISKGMNSIICLPCHRSQAYNKHTMLNKALRQYQEGVVNAIYTKCPKCNVKTEEHKLYDTYGKWVGECWKCLYSDKVKGVRVNGFDDENAERYLEELEQRIAL